MTETEHSLANCVETWRDSFLTAQAPPVDKSSYAKTFDTLAESFIREHGATSVKDIAVVLLDGTRKQDALPPALKLRVQFFTVLWLLHEEGRRTGTESEWFLDLEPTDQQTIRKHASKWFRFCYQPIAADDRLVSRFPPSDEGRGFIYLMTHFAPGLDLQETLRVLVRFVVVNQTCPNDAESRRRQDRDWYVPRAAARLNERHAMAEAGRLLADPALALGNRPGATACTRRAQRVIRTMAFGQSWLMHAARIQLCIELGWWFQSLMELPRASGYPLGILAGQALIFLARVWAEPTWLAIAMYRQVGVLAVGVGPMLFSSEIWTLSTMIAAHEHANALTALLCFGLLSLAGTLVLTEVNSARGFRFRPRAWWPTPTFGRASAETKLGQAIRCSSARELFGLLVPRAVLLIWTIAPIALELVPSAQPGSVKDSFVTDESALAFGRLVAMLGTLAVALGLILQQLWQSSTLGKGVEVDE